MARVPYDEFSLFAENAAEFGIAYTEPPVVERVGVDVGANRMISALRWGTGDPELVLIHGGAQNAHTWDTVALALGRPLVAIDLPGHGHSDGGPAGATNPAQNGIDLAIAVRELAPNAALIVGMSLGGLSAIALSAQAPALVRRLALIDITPGVTSDQAAHITAFVNGPASFASFDDLYERTKAFNPTRSASSLRRGILHNAVQLEDETWVWRYARHRSTPLSVEPDFVDLWAALGELTVPVLLVRAMAHGSVVSDDNERQFTEVTSRGRVARVEGAGHSVQGDKPVELAALLVDFMSLP